MGMTGHVTNDYCVLFHKITVCQHSPICCVNILVDQYFVLLKGLYYFIVFLSYIY